ncbi:aspartyl-phosphate phosphatase Spo0E family protein [Tissierella carlieri]|nr:aspartyl-phosphate phosphatase Spo0E family protein [Tissierella sp. P1]MBU5311539.1 aspartyl-phosphate phosphatase Spo0E family protein [Tissierella carlieri]
MKREVKGVIMKKSMSIEELKEEIQKKREELNKIVSEGLDKDRILRYSQELDQLISKYYSLGA